MSTQLYYRYRKLYKVLVALTICIATTSARSEVVVIVNLENPVQSMTPQEISDFFLGRSRVFSSGIAAEIYEQPRDAQTRQEFFHLINGMSLKMLNAYWARLQFSGEVQPPLSLSDSKAVLAAVRKSKGGLGYIDASVLDNSVKVILRLKE